MKNSFWDIINWSDFIIVPILLSAILFISNEIFNSKIHNNPAYRYFLPCLKIKLLYCLVFFFIYNLVLSSGDSWGYFRGNFTLVRFFFENPNGFFRLLIFSDTGPISQSLSKEFLPPYLFDERSFVINKLTLILNFISLNSFLGNCLIYTFVTYLLTWKLFLLLYSEEKPYSNMLALGMFCFPSIACWSSLLLKDGLILSLSCLFCYVIFKFQKEMFLLLKIKYILISLITIIIIGAIRPFMVVPLITGSILYFYMLVIAKFDSLLLKFTFFPLMIMSILFSSYLFFSYIDFFLDEFSLKNIISEANARKSTDVHFLTQFNLSGILSMDFKSLLTFVPLSTLGAIFRPFFWEIKSYPDFFAFLESLLIIFFLGFLIIKIGIYSIFKKLFSSPMLVMFLTMAILFAFFAGFTTNNIGSLLRFRMFSLFFFIVIYSKLFLKHSVANSKSIQLY